MITFQPRAHFPKPRVLTVTHARTRSVRPALQPPLDPRGTSTLLQGGGRGEASTAPAAEGLGLGVLSPDPPLPPWHARGHCCLRSPRRAGCSRQSPAPPRGLPQRPLGPWGGRFRRGGCGRRDPGGKGLRRGRRSRGAPPPCHPPSRVRAQHPAFPSPSLPGCSPRRLQAAASEARGSRLDSLAGNPRSSRPPLLPGAGQGSGQESPEAPGVRASCPTQPPPARAEQSPRRFSGSGSRRLTVAAARRRQGSGEEGGEAQRRRLLSLSAARLLGSKSPKWSPGKDPVPALRSAPTRPTIAPAGRGAPASLQPRARAGLPLPAAPGRRPCQHCCPT